MALSKGPGSDTATNLSVSLDTLSNTSIGGSVDGISSVISGKQIDTFNYLKRMVDEVDRPIIKKLGMDMINVLGSFYYNEEFLCCLVKNMIMMTHGANSIQRIQDALNKNKNINLYDGVSTEELGINATIDSIIFVLDTIIALLQFKLRDIVIPTLDISETIISAVMDAIIIAIQSIITSSKSAALDWILESIKKNTGTNAAYTKCQPFVNLFNILSQYVEDYGLFDWLISLINGKLGKLHARWSAKNKSEELYNIKSLEWLKYIRSLFVKIKTATISWELCVDLQTLMQDELTKKSSGEQSYYDFLNNSNKGDPYLDPSQKTGVVLNDDNSILTNVGINDSKFNRISTPTNSDINAFLKNSLGLPVDLVDQITNNTTSLDNVDGTNTNNSFKTGNDCGYILSENDIKNAVLAALKNNGLT